MKRVKLRRGSDDSSEAEEDSDFDGSELSSSASEDYASDQEASDDEEFRESSEPESDGKFLKYSSRSLSFLNTFILPIYVVIGLDSAVKGKQKGKKGKKKGAPKEKRELPSKEAIDRVWEMRKELLDKIEKLGERLPPNTLDQLIDDLGGPEDVAEVW